MKIIVHRISLGDTLSVTLTNLIDGGATMSGKRLNKTYLMQLVENRYPGYTIEALLVKAFRDHGSEKDAADALGITQQTFSSWKYRLGLQDKISDTLSIPTNYPSTR